MVYDLISQNLIWILDRIPTRGSATQRLLIEHGFQRVELLTEPSTMQDQYSHENPDLLIWALEDPCEEDFAVLADLHPRNIPNVSEILLFASVTLDNIKRRADRLGLYDILTFDEAREILFDLVEDRLLSRVPSREFLIERADGDYFDLKYSDHASVMHPTSVSWYPLAPGVISVPSGIMTFADEIPGFQITVYGVDISHEQAQQWMREILANIEQVTGQHGNIVDLGGHNLSKTILDSKPQLKHSNIASHGSGFDVIFINYKENKMKAIYALKQITGRETIEIVDIVEVGNLPILAGVTWDRAQSVATQLAEIGVEVQIIPNKI
jgi:ribosomal protein L7/L12